VKSVADVISSHCHPCSWWRGRVIDNEDCELVDRIGDIGIGAVVGVEPTDRDREATVLGDLFGFLEGEVVVRAIVAATVGRRACACGGGGASGGVVVGG